MINFNWGFFIFKIFYYRYGNKEYFIKFNFLL
nr:MAG TPA: hypothetical protein [Caudoviricetes sp.]